MRFLSILLLIVFIAVVAVFCVQNRGAITVAYPGDTISVPMPILVLVVYLLGMFSGWAVVGFLRRSVRDVTQQFE